MNLRQISTMATVAVAAAAVTAVVTLSITRASGQQSAGEHASRRRRARPARIDGKPNFSGIWQAQQRSQLGSAGARGASRRRHAAGRLSVRVRARPGGAGSRARRGWRRPGSLGVVQGDGKIPYKPEALATKKENVEHWIDRDPELKCYLPGIPRAMYMPYPFQITQSTNKIHMAYAFSNTARTIHLDKVEDPPDDTWMGHSVGRWEGDTLVVDVTISTTRPGSTAPAISTATRCTSPSASR